MRKAGGVISKGRVLSSLLWNLAMNKLRVMLECDIYVAVTCVSDIVMIFLDRFVYTSI